MTNHIHHEAADLFGSEIALQASRLEPAMKPNEAQAVAKAAGDLRKQSGYPENQRALIRSLPERTTLLLCRWVMDRRFASQCITHAE